MSFSSHESPMRMPCGPYFYMPYSCPTWPYNPWMPASHSYFGQNHVIYREPVINESSLRNNDRFHQRDRSMQKNKHKVIKQVYRVKRDGRLNKNSDLTLGKEKPVVEEQSVNSIDEIVLHDDHGSNNIVEQCSSLAVRQDKSNHIGSDRTGLTGSSDRSEPKNLVVQKIGPSRPLRSFWINTRRYLHKNKAINWKANEKGVLHHQDQESINGHRIGLRHSSRRCMYHGLHIQVCLIHGLVIILGCHIMIISFILYQGAMICIIGRIGRLKIFVIEHAKEYKAETIC